MPDNTQETVPDSTQEAESDSSQEAESDSTLNSDSEDGNNAHAIIRESVNKRQLKCRDKMSKQHNAKRKKNLHTFKVKDFVSVFIPSVDRGHSDLPRLPGQIYEVKKHKGNDAYLIATCYGILNVSYYAKDLEIYHGVLELNFVELKNAKRISLRAAASMESQHSDNIAMILIRCDCSGKCNTGHCKCFKAGSACTSHCHDLQSKKKIKNICTNKTDQ